MRSVRPYAWIVVCLLSIAPAAAEANTQGADAVAAGKKQFARYCVSCHGASAEGTRRAPSLVSETTRRATPAETENLLRNGKMKPGMPSWSGLPKQRRAQIIAFLQSLHVTPAATW